MEKNEIILFETSDHAVKLNINTDGDTVWLNRAQFAELFDRNVSVIGRHINAVFMENELNKEGNVQNLHIPNSDKSVEFCHKIGLDYVSCSPFRVPNARLAATQTALR